VDEDDSPPVEATLLWAKYVSAGGKGVRLHRVLPQIVCYLAACLLMIKLFGFPAVPFRGLASEVWDVVFLAFSIISTVCLTFLVADATILNTRLIHYLTKNVTNWPPEAFEAIRRRRLGLIIEYNDVEIPAGKPSELALREYLDIELIARRTEPVGELIYYPFLILSLMLLSRLNLFDNWQWPAGLVLVFLTSAGYALWSAFLLRSSAEEARRKSLGRLEDLRLAYTLAEKHESDLTMLEKMMEAIREESRGAFASISRHPIFGAILLPSGGLSLWAVVQYLPKLFG
jgi:hypothetical protein